MSEKYVTDNSELGYFAEGEPTDAQLKFQDTVDNTIQDLLNEMQAIYAEAKGIEFEDVEWDIGKITRIRELVEDMLNLPDMY